ncbi:hypothetical protein GM160_10510 [Guyparkeria halophila]|uniref:Uncharacterized protein n=1 Tax=Guyparkeria halophila TaxID=47960 RepID=A0A6I6D709_9GAMM|nr:hypothetical protein [Guyparkeria halophila]QGT79284.1 hypothetical protein GM160_10510 [Guyparkeria halophila]
MRSKSWLAHPITAVLFLLAAAWCVYWPGLGGGFLFDDHSNLALLGMYGVVDDWQTFWLYLLSGFSGPTGRPVSHLSFLIDANHWPADPWPFKRTNVLIHLATGVLLFGLMRSLLLASGQSAARAGGIAAVAMGLWLLHPFWVSTTLYVVQRMAQLAALFSVAGLWLWVEWRRRCPPQANWRAWTVAVVAVWGFGLLAVLSKENGALLPALVLVLEVTILAAMDQRLGQQPGRSFRGLRWVVLGLPLALLALYVARSVPALLAGEAGNRDFTPFERLLTQGRILWDYVFNILLPRPYPGGLFNDDIRLSTGPFTPWITALAWLAWIALVAWAIRVRRGHPFVAAAVLFFLAGHLLESTFIQLELYFEHRSYLPAMLLGLPLALWWLTRAPVPKDIRIAVPVGVLLLLAAMTFMRADLWSSPYLQALKWAKVSPESPRAQHHLANFWWETGNVAEAVRLNDRAIALDPDGLPWRMTRVMYACRDESLAGSPERAIDAVVKALGHAPRVGAVAAQQTETLLDYLMSGDCGEWSRPEAILAMMDRLTAERDMDGGRLERLLWQRGALLHLRRNEPRQAAENLRHLVAATDDRGVALRSAAMLASHGHYRLALDLLEDDWPEGRVGGRISIDRVRHWYIERTGYYQQEREHLEALMREDEANERDRVPRLLALP